MKLERFLAINAPAAGAASRALAKLTRRPVVVKMLNARVVRLPQDRPKLDREELAVGIYMSIIGGIQGAALLCFTEPRARAVAAMLVGRPPGGSLQMTELEESALKELANIICGNYVTALSNQLGAKILPGLPNITRGLCGSMLEQVILRGALDSREALLIDVELDLPEFVTMGFLLVCLKVEHLIEVR
ncbi:MAG: chemotaxis protein CheC [Elusimicrobia bacterium]|nr:chemotaxis protein CheC [Elusimicrobiota bacterium]